MLSLQQVSATDSDRDIKLRACSEDFDGDSNDLTMATECQHSILDELRDVPQALFELSLRDLVELPQMIGNAMQEKQSEERDFTARKSRSWEGRKKATKKRKARSQSMDIGVGFLKWIVPLSSSGRKERFVFVSPSSSTSGASNGERGESRQEGQGGGESTRSASANSSCSISKKLAGCFFLHSRKQNSS